MATVDDKTAIDDQTIIDPSEAPKPAAPAAEEEPAYVTIEDTEHEAAVAELAADEAAPAAAKPAEPDADEKAEFTKVAEAEGEKAKPVEGKPPPTDGERADGLMAALTQSRKREQELAVSNARLEGQTQAMAFRLRGGPVQGADGAQPATPEPTPAAKIATVREQRIALAKEYDEGELSAVEMETRRQALEDEENAAREAQAQAARPAPAAPPTDSEVERNILRLEAEYPIITKISKEDMLPFKGQAIEYLRMKGEAIGSGSLETQRLHNTMAAMAAHRYSFEMKPQGEQKPEEGQQPQGDTTGQGQKPGELSQDAKEREAAIAKRDAHPPDVTALGTGAEGTNTDAALEQKFDDLKTDDERIAFMDQFPNMTQRLGLPTG